MDINKSSRHSKITGDFGETVVLYWLSKYGFECARVDHTGIDIIARNPHTKELMGVSVKSRTRSAGSEDEFVSIPNDNFEKAQKACDDFGGVPYFAIVVDAGEVIRVFLLSKEHLLQLFPRGKTSSGWKMTEQFLKKYDADPAIMTFEFCTITKCWWKKLPEVKVQADE